MVARDDESPRGSRWSRLLTVIGQLPAGEQKSVLEGFEAVVGAMDRPVDPERVRQRLHELIDEAAAEDLVAGEEVLVALQRPRELGPLVSALLSLTVEVVRVALETEEELIARRRTEASEELAHIRSLLAMARDEPSN